MNPKEMKELLLSYPKMTAVIYSINVEIAQIKKQAAALEENVRPANTTGNSIEFAVSDATYKKAKKIMDFFEYRISVLLTSVESIQKRQSLITDLVRKLPTEEREIIEERYFHNTKWDYLPFKLHLSRRTCFNIHDRAILHLLSGFRNH